MYTMKQHYLFLFLITISLSVNAQFAIVNQTSGQTTNGVLAVDHLFTSLDCRLADDFTVPAGETWYIDSVSLLGFYDNSTGTIDSVGMNITIYEDNNGAIGAQVFAEVISEDLDPGLDGTITASWSTPIQLSAGTYWLAASARNFVFSQTPWYWYLDSVGFENKAQWENPFGGYNAGCTAWTDIDEPTCLDQDYDAIMFQVYGCLGSTKPTINELPEDTTFCFGPTFTLNASSNSAGVDFVWNTGDSTASITVSEAGTYVVTAYDPVTLCGATSNIFLDILPEPVSNVENDTICASQSRTFISACNTCTFLWNDGSTSNNITVNEEGWVSVTMTDNSTGCVGVDSGWLEIVPLPPVQFTPDNPAHGCEGDTFELGTQETYNSYFWNRLGWPSLRLDSSIMVHQKGPYFITVTNSLGCIITDTAEVFFHPIPTPTITTEFEPVDRTRVTAEGGFQTYKWSNGQTDDVIIVSKPGVYSLTVTDEFGCVGVSNLFVTVPPAGINESLPEQVKVYPNPTQDIIQVQGSQDLANSIKLFDASGALVLDQRITFNVESISLGSLPEGQYIISLFKNEELIGSANIVKIDHN